MEHSPSWESNRFCS